MNQRSTSDTALKVVFIGGSPRSGSTVCEMLLGQLPRVVAVGELYNVWSREFGHNEFCSCGERFQICPRWKAVTDGDVDAFAGAPLPEIRRLWRSVLRLRRVPSLAWPAAAGRRYRDDLEAYAALVAQLYRRIAAVADAEVVIDSSKEPNYGYFLRRVPGIELHVLHLVRDSRAVAYSWTRKKRRNPETAPRSGFLPTRSAPRSALEWDAYNLGTEALRWGAASYTRVRYDDLIDDPAQVLQAVAAATGLGRVDLGFLEAGTAQVKPLHTVGGNPVRFGGDRLTLRRDAAWKEELPRRDHRLVTALTWPLLIRYAGRPQWAQHRLPPTRG